MRLEKLLVYADFDWLKEPVCIGTLFQEFLRGNPKYSFEFSKEWLSDYNAITLSAELNNFVGRQYVQPPLDFFGCFNDSLPDRWGRLLLMRREQIQAQKESRPVRTLSPFDYLAGIEDQTRLGGFRFKTSETSEFLNIEPHLPVPPITSIRELADAAANVERSELKKTLPEEKWLAQLIEPGSSLGGARPKANVRDIDGELWIAKFASVNDLTDIGAWEHLAYVLAEKAGIKTAPSKVLHCGQHHIFLVKRFDRKKGRRIHFASAMTLLGLKDGDNASSGFGYLDIVEKIVQLCVNAQENLEELYRRVAFSICIGNSDDHFRNHGFLLTSKGWELSPAFDMNPTMNRSQSLLISDSSNAADLNVLLEAAYDYMLTASKAQEIVDEVLTAMKDWQKEAMKLNLSARDISMFEERFMTKL